jgi:hypothetical protein
VTRRHSPTRPAARQGIRPDLGPSGHPCARGRCAPRDRPRNQSQLAASSSRPVEIAPMWVCSPDVGPAPLARLLVDRTLFLIGRCENAG